MVNIRPLNAELRKIACEELNEVETRIPDDLATLRAWLEMQPHLKTRTDDQFLVTFLRGCKYSMEKAKSKLDYFYTLKTILPEIFANRRVDEECLELCRTGACLRLPKPFGPGGPRIQLTIYSRFELQKYAINELYRHQSYYMDLQICTDDNSIVSGYLDVYDMSQLRLSFLAQFDFLLIKQLVFFAEKASPLRLKGVHLVNCPKEAQTVLSLVRSCLPQKLKERFYVHKNLEELFKHIPKEYFPTEYGGSNGSIPEIQALMEKKLLTLNEYFIEDHQYGVDESLRPGKKLDRNTLFGIEGSFRKLDID